MGLPGDISEKSVCSLGNKVNCVGENLDPGAVPCPVPVSWARGSCMSRALDVCAGSAWHQEGWGRAGGLQQLPGFGAGKELARVTPRVAQEAPGSEAEL